MDKNQHVTPSQNGGWKVIGEDNSKATKITKTKAEAVAVAKQIAKNQQSELLIHKQDGQISERNTYGKDPYPPKG